ncbi:hypothetical protein ACROYT_G042157 [Oculina patagonica]
MAEGGGHFGYEDTALDRDLDHDVHDDKDDDDKQEVDTTRRSMNPHRTTRNANNAARTERAVRHLLRRNTFAWQCAINERKELRRLQQLKKDYQKDLESAKKEVSALDKQVKSMAKEKEKVDRLRASLAAKKRERNTLEKRLNTTRTLDELKELKEQEAEMQRQNEEDREVINDENASSTEKQAAEETVAERTAELLRLQTQTAERERELPLRERIKEIFKKYGVTVTAIFLAAGVTIGAVIGAITNSLKATGKALGKGLTNVG